MAKNIFEIPWDDTEQLATFLDDYQEDVEGAIDARLEELAPELISRIEQLTPVLTGALQAGYSYNIADQTIEVFNSMYYFIFVENGTIHMQGRFMVMQAMSEFEQLILEAVVNDAGNLTEQY
jgi:hypothetical protein